MDKDLERSTFRSAHRRKNESGDAKIPKFITSLARRNGAVLIQTNVRGASFFRCSDAMADAFVTADEANFIYGESKADPDAVMRQLLVSADRPAYIKAVTDLLCRAKPHQPSSSSSRPPCFQSVSSCVARVRPRRSATKSAEVLCLIELRAVVAEDGSSLTLGVRLTPEAAVSAPPAPEAAFLYALGSSLRVDLAQVEEGAASKTKKRDAASPASSRKSEERLAAAVMPKSCDPVSSLGSAAASSFDIQQAFLTRKKIARDVRKQDSGMSL